MASSTRASRPRSTTTSSTSFASRLATPATWPPIVYFVLGIVCLLFWAAGTAIQIQTSEAWIMHTSVSILPTISTYMQVWYFIRGELPADQIVPFAFGWGVQLALIIASVGVEMPRHPKWRYYSCWAVILGLIAVNSAGDYNYSSAYGGWGQLGFTVVILFITFGLGLLAVMCFVQGFSRVGA